MKYIILSIISFIMSNNSFAFNPEYSYRDGQEPKVLDVDMNIDLYAGLGPDGISVGAKKYLFRIESNNSKEISMSLLGIGYGSNGKRGTAVISPVKINLFQYGLGLDFETENDLQKGGVSISVSF